MTEPENSVKQQPGSTEPVKHILIVDDDTEITQSISFALRDLGFKVSIARDGNQGIAFAETHTPDLIILDMMMPRRSGFLVLERLRQIESDPIPVIMITGNEGQRHRQYAEMLGVSDYIHKPFPMDKLVSSVKRVLDAE